MNTDPGLAFVDIYRVRDGKVVEFWDVMQEVSTTFVSGYEMF
jgi:predicted SnoaL-like aldol condensation-catalyzing enzyme